MSAETDRITDSIVAQIKDLMREHGIGGSELARRMDVHPQWTSNFLHGRHRNLEIKTIVKLFAAFGEDVKIFPVSELAFDPCALVA